MSPLTSLLKKKLSGLAWNKSAKQAFNQVKQAFFTAVTLINQDQRSLLW